MIYDIGIIGLGIAGVMANLRIAEKYSDAKVIAIEAGRPCGKRRSQMQGWFGLFANGDGKLYQNDINKVSEITNVKKTKSANSFFESFLSKVGNFDIIKDKSPNISVEKRIKKLGYNIQLNNFMQIVPKEVHLLSKYIYNYIEEIGNTDFIFDTEVNTVYKQKGTFIITTEHGEFKCKKLILAVGRSGWRWARDLYKNFGIIDDNNTAKYGVRIEMEASGLKDFNNSNCTLFKNQDLEIGPFSWLGTVIPEDHVDTAISAFRSNENRWVTDKVSFSVIGNRYFPDSGFEQVDRLSKLTFILTNERVMKERVAYLVSGKSKISIIPEYNWLPEVMNELSNIIPELITKAYFHVPTIVPLAPKINLGNNLESEISKMYVAGESSGVTGILSAALTGIIAADSACK